MEPQARFCTGIPFEFYEMEKNEKVKPKHDSSPLMSGFSLLY